jgi:hypothetical protein
VPGGAGEAAVQREQRRIEHLGKGHVDPVVRGEGVTQSPHAPEQRLVRIADHVECTQIVGGLGSVGDRHLT